MVLHVELLNIFLLIFDLFNQKFLPAHSVCEHSLIESKKGKKQIFLIIRNPLVRTVYSLAEKNGNDKLNSTSIEKYLRDTDDQRNLLTRSLLCKFKGKLDQDDLARAKGIIENKCTVAVFPDYGGALKSYETFLGLQLTNPMRTCITNRLSDIWIETQNFDAHLTVVENSKILREANGHDMHLFLPHL